MPGRRQFTMADFAWLVAYVATMSGVVYYLYSARQDALASFATPAAQAEWKEFREEMQRQAKDPSAPVARRPPKSIEPPTLRLLRDYFGTVVMIGLLLSSALFATLMFMIRGVFSGQRYVPRKD